MDKTEKPCKSVSSGAPGEVEWAELRELDLERVEDLVGVVLGGHVGGG